MRRPFLRGLLGPSPATVGLQPIVQRPDFSSGDARPPGFVSHLKARQCTHHTLGSKAPSPRYRIPPRLIEKASSYPHPTTHLLPPRSHTSGYPPLLLIALLPIVLPAEDRWILLTSGPF